MRQVRLMRAYDVKAAALFSAIATGDSHLVQQHLADEVDINTIVRRFGITGQMPSGVAAGVYGDFTGIEDYESAVDAVERARAGFLALPAAVREKYGNDPGMLIAHAQGVPMEQLEDELRAMEAPGVAAAPLAPAARDEAAVTP